MKLTKRLCILAALIALVCLCAVSVSAVEYVEDMSSDPEATLAKFVDIDAFYECLAEGMANCETSIDISQFRIPRSTEMTQTIYYYIYYSMADYFHASDIQIYVYPSYYAYLAVTYDCDVQEYRERKVWVDGQLDAMLEGVKDNDSLSDAEKALILHDRVITRLSYDRAYFTGEREEYYRLYDCLKNNTAICTGYAVVYSKLLDAVGIPNSFCGSNVINHVWNIVTIDGVQYHVDTTWDDPLYDITGRVDHENFLRSTAGIIESGHIGDDIVDYATTPTDTRYDNAYWQNSQAEFQLLDGEIYYIDSSAAMLRRRTDSGYTDICSVKNTWYASSNSYYPKNYARLSNDGQRLLYSGPDAVCALNPDTGIATVLWQPDRPGPYYWIYGFTYRNGELICDLYNSPSFTLDTQLDYQVRKAYAPASTSGSCGKNARWSLDEHGVLEITGTGSTDSWTGTQAPWYGLRDQIRYVRIAKGVTGLGAGAFGEGYSIFGVYLPDSLTTFGQNAFYSYLGIRFAYGGTAQQWQALHAPEDSQGASPELLHTQCDSSTIGYWENCVNRGIYCSQCKDFVTRELTADGAHTYAESHTCTQCGYVRSATSLSVLRKPTTAVYDLFTQAPDLTGGQLTVTYTDGSVQTVSMTRATVTGFDASQVGYQNVTLTYADMTAACQLLVKPLAPTALFVSGYPNVTWLEWTALSPEDITVIAQYPMGQYAQFDATWTNMTVTPEEYGYEKVTLRCGDAIADFRIFRHSSYEKVMDPSGYPASSGAQGTFTTYTAEDADMLMITFNEQSRTEQPLCVYDGNWKPIVTLEGTIGEHSIYIPGNTFHLEVTPGAADYRFDTIIAYYAVHTEPMPDVFTSADCTEDTEASDVCCLDCGAFLYREPGRTAPGHSYKNGQCVNCEELEGQIFAACKWGRLYAFDDFADVNRLEAGVYVRLEADATVNVTLTQDLYLDLNGYDLSGIIRPNGHKIYGMDAATHDYEFETCGNFSCTDGTGKAVIPEIATACDTRTVVGVWRYLTVETEGAYQFHRYELRLKRVSLLPATGGISYRATWQGSAAVLAALHDTTAAGFSLSVSDRGAQTFYVTKSRLETGKELILNIEDFDVAGYGKAPLNLTLQMKLKNGKVVEGASYVTTLYDQLKTVSSHKENLVLSQLQALGKWITTEETFQAWDQELDLGYSSTDEKPDASDGGVELN